MALKGPLSNLGGNYMDNQIIDKITKLLARAENNPFAGEAQACMLKAQQLMVKHNLTAADISEGTTFQAEVSKLDLTGYARTIWWKKDLAYIITKNFRCKNFLINNHHTRRSKIVVLGLKEDVEIAMRIFHFAVEAINSCSSQYLKEAKKQGLSIKGLKNTYILGFLNGLEAQFAEQVSRNDWGLIIVEDPLVTQAYNELSLRKGRAVSVTTSKNKAALQRGYQDGKNFNALAGRLE